MLPHEETSANRKAALLIAERAGGSLTERRELLDMLGLIDSTGHGVAPDDERINDVAPIHGGGEDGMGSLKKNAFANIYDGPPMSREFVPEGLRNLPAPSPEVSKRAAKSRPDYTPKQSTSKPAAERSARKTTRAYSGKPRGEAKCGTLSGPARHRRNHEPVCKACRDVRTEYQAKRREKEGSKRRAPLAPCGTYAAYKRHYKKGQPIDEACRLAAREASKKYWHERAARNKAAAAKAVEEARDEGYQQAIDVLAS